MDRASLFPLGASKSTTRASSDRCLRGCPSWWPRPHATATPTHDSHAHTRWSRPRGLWLLRATSWSQPPGSGDSPRRLSCPVQGRPPRGVVCREELRWGHSQGYGHRQGGPQLQRHIVPHNPTQRLVVMDTRSHGGIRPILRDGVTATATTQPFVGDIHPFQEEARRRPQSWRRPLHQQPLTHTPPPRPTTARRAGHAVDPLESPPPRARSTQQHHPLHGLPQKAGFSWFLTPGSGGGIFSYN